MALFHIMATPKGPIQPVGSLPFLLMLAFKAQVFHLHGQYMGMVSQPIQQDLGWLLTAEPLR